MTQFHSPNEPHGSAPYRAPAEMPPEPPLSLRERLEKTWWGKPTIGAVTLVLALALIALIVEGPGLIVIAVTAKPDHAWSKQDLVIAPVFTVMGAAGIYFGAKFMNGLHEFLSELGEIVLRK